MGGGGIKKKDAGRGVYGKHVYTRGPRLGGVIRNRVTGEAWPLQDLTYKGDPVRATPVVVCDPPIAAELPRLSQRLDYEDVARRVLAR